VFLNYACDTSRVHDAAAAGAGEVTPAAVALRR
jgi:hypothetical protein